jgi:hypothetical protein
MKKIRNPKRVKTLFTSMFIIFTVAACTGGDNHVLEETISAQSTWIAHLSTQVTKQEQMNWDQWEAIGHLYTQMPYALGIITPIPPGVTITLTPTPYSSDDQEPRSNFTPTPSPSIDIEYPPDMRTGIDEIDAVIDVILSEDINARLDIVRLTTAACTMETGLGGPPKCKGEEDDGTPIDIFPISYGEGIFIRPGSLREVFSFSIRGLFAVYKLPEEEFKAQYWPAGDYGIVFTSEDDGNPHIITVLVEDGRIVRLGFDYDWPPFERVREKSDEFILSPIR